MIKKVMKKGTLNKNIFQSEDAAVEWLHGHLEVQQEVLSYI